MRTSNATFGFSRGLQIKRMTMATAKNTRTRSGKYMWLKCLGAQVAESATVSHTNYSTGMMVK